MKLTRRLKLELQQTRPVSDAQPVRAGLRSDSKNVVNTTTRLGKTDPKVTVGQATNQIKPTQRTPHGKIRTSTDRSQASNWNENPK